MVAYCCICKLGIGEVECVSFHTLPKNETLRAKWFMAIGREVNKHCGVCSRHFEESDFIYKVIKDTVRRFLKPGAYPSILLTEHFYRKNTKNTQDDAVAEHSIKLEQNEQFSPNNDSTSQDLPDSEKYDVNGVTSSASSLGALSNIAATSDYMDNGENIENPFGESPCNYTAGKLISESDYSLEQKPIIIWDNEGTTENTIIKSEFMSEDFPEMEKYNVKNGITSSVFSPGARSNFIRTSEYVVKDENIENPLGQSLCNGSSEEYCSKIDFNLDQKPIIILHNEATTDNPIVKSEFMSEDLHQMEKHNVKNGITSSVYSSGAISNFIKTSECVVKDENIENLLGQSLCNGTAEEHISEAGFNLEQKPTIIMDNEETTGNPIVKSEFVSEDLPELEKYNVNEMTSSLFSSGATSNFTGTTEYVVKDEIMENQLSQSPSNDAEESISQADYSLEQKPNIIPDDEEMTENPAWKRKGVPPLTGTRRFFNPRFIGDLRREDFNSIHAWQLVQKYILDTKTNTRTLKQRVKRLTEKVKTLEARIK